MEGENIDDHLKSLQKAIELQPKVLFCGLKGRLDDATGRLIRKHDNWWELGRRVVQMHEAGASRDEILSAVMDGEVLFYHLSQRNWGRRHLLNSIMDNRELFENNKKYPLQDI